MKEADILNWAHEYHKNRDLVFRKLDIIVRENERLVLKHRDGTSEVVIGCAELSNFKLGNVEGEVSVFVPNTKKNLDLLIKDWKSFITHKGLKFIFFNPHSLLDKRWIVKPYVHDQVSDPASLKQGLKAMFESVDAVQ